MVSQAEIDLTRRAYESFNRTGEIDYDLLDPDIEWSEGTEVPEPEVFHGHEGVRRQQEALWAALKDVRLEPLEFIPAGDDLVVILHMRARGRASDVPVELRLAHRWTIRDGKATRFVIYGDPEQALEAARQRSA